MRNIMIAVAVLASVHMAGTPMAEARGRHGHQHGGFGHHRFSARAMGAGRASHRESGARDISHADGATPKAVLEAEDRLLKQKLKSICRGC